MKVSIVSPCFYPSEDYAEPLLTSAKKHNFKVQLYGVGEPFVSYFDAKVLRLRDKLRQIRTRYSIYIDCRDVLWLDGPHKIMDAYFVQRHSKVVIGTEVTLWPFATDEFRQWFDERYPAPFRYPAPGMMVGRTDAMLHVLDSLVAVKPVVKAEMQHVWNPKYDGDDMPLWNWGLPRGKIDARLDSSCMMTTVMRPELKDKFLIAGGRVKCKDTGCKPVILHFNCQNRKRQRAYQQEIRRELWGDV